MKYTSKLLILLVATLTIACATTGGELVSRGGVVAIQNQSGEAIEVFIDGSRFTVMGPGERVEIDKILSGRRVLTAIAVETGLRIEREFDLEKDHVQDWTVGRFQAVDSSGAPQNVTCSLDVVNGLKTSVEVTLPELPVRTVGAGATVRINDLQPGAVHVEARATDTGLVTAAEIDLRPGVVPAFRLVQPRGAFRVVNRSGRAAMVVAGTFPARQVADGESTVYSDIDDATMSVIVLDVANRRLGEFTPTLVPGEVIDLTVNRPSGVVKIVSDLDSEVSIFADGTYVGACPPQGGITIQGLVKGPNHLRALNSSGDTVSIAQLDITDEPALWLLSATGDINLRAGTGAIEVQNPSTEPVSIFIDGYSLGVVDAGARRTFVDMVPGSHQATVIGKQSNSFASASIDTTETRTTVWKVELPASTLSVENVSGEDIGVYNDGILGGTVAAGEKGFFAVAEGQHTVDITGRTTAVSVRRTLSFPAGTTTSIRFSSQYVTVVATNRFSDPMEVRIGERILGVLNPGERVTVSDVRPGSIRLSATSTTRPVSMTTLIDLVSGDAFDWNIAP